MKRFIYLCLLLWLVACGGAANLPAETPTDRPLIATVGETIEIKLNYINNQPYIWQPVEPLPTALEQIGVSNTLPPVIQGEDVTYAQQNWTFEALTTGEYELTFAYRSAFDAEEPASEQKVYTIIIE